MTSSLSINDFNGACRCCGLKKANLQSLFGSSLDHMLKTVASVDVQQNDGLPELICVQCVLLVSRSFQFKAQVEKTYKDLRSILTKSLPNKFKNESFSNKTQDPKNTCKRSEEIMSEDSNNVSLKREPEDTGNLEFVVSNYASCLSNISETPKNTEDHVEIKNNKIQSIIIQLGNESKQANISQREESNILDRETLFSENNPEVQSNQNVTAIRLQENQLHIIDDRVLSFEEQNEKVNAISDNSNYPNLAEFMDVQNFRLTSTASIEVHNSSITRENNEGINDDDTNQVSLLSDVGMDTDDSSMSEYLNREFTVEDVIEHTGFQSNSILQSEPEAVIALLECGICKKNFTHNKQLQRHLKTHNPAKAHICIVCDKGFTEASNLKKHMKKHTGELRDIAGKPNLCQFCGKKFKWATSLAKHMKLHTKKRLFQCPQCPKYYVESCSLKQHLRTHTGEKPFQCTTCDRSFVQSCNLVKHMRVHTGERPFECPVCHKRFSQSGYITVHMRCHNGERPYKCDVCGDSFAGSNTLTTHKRIHTGERPYACDICDKKFGRQETAVLHKMTHTREKPHVCAICEKSFRTSSNLQVHVKSHNLENKD